MEPKNSTKKIGGPLSICSGYIIVYIKKCRKVNDRKKTNFSPRGNEKVYTVTASVYPKM